MVGHKVSILSLPPTEACEFQVQHGGCAGGSSTQEASMPGARVRDRRLDGDAPWGIWESPERMTP